LYVPGTVYQLYVKPTPENPKFTVIENTTAERFSEMVISRTMLTDHIPNKYDRGLDRAFECLMMTRTSTDMSMDKDTTLMSGAQYDNGQNNTSYLASPVRDVAPELVETLGNRLSGSIRKSTATLTYLLESNVDENVEQSETKEDLDNEDNNDDLNYEDETTPKAVTRNQEVQFQKLKE
jgi:hypothetical protein